MILDIGAGGLEHLHQVLAFDVEFAGELIDSHLILAQTELLWRPMSTVRHYLSRQTTIDLPKRLNPAPRACRTRRLRTLCSIQPFDSLAGGQVEAIFLVLLPRQAHAEGRGESVIPPELRRSIPRRSRRLLPRLAGAPLQRRPGPIRWRPAPHLPPAPLGRRQKADPSSAWAL